MSEWIGKVDINGKHIYERDIVIKEWLGSNHVGIVHFFFGEFIGITDYNPKRMPDEKSCGNMWYFSMLGDIRSSPNAMYEVIGNLDDNPWVFDDENEREYKERESLFKYRRIFEDKRKEISK